MGRLASNLFLKDRCPLPDQMSFVLTLPWRAFILTMRDGDRADKNEIAIFVFSKPAKDFPHDVLLMIKNLSQN